MLKQGLRTKRTVLLIATAVFAVAVVAAGTALAATPLKTGQTIYYIPKDTLNPYEVIADHGGALATKEIGDKQVVSLGHAGHRRGSAAVDPDRDPVRRQRDRDRR